MKEFLASLGILMIALGLMKIAIALVMKLTEKKNDDN